MFDSGIKMYGKHATYLKFMSKKTKELNKDAIIAPIFVRYIDTYIAAAIIGAVQNRRAIRDTESTDSATLFDGQVIGESEKLKLLYRMIIMTDTSMNLSEEDKINLAFRTTEKEYSTKGMELFTSYVRGGLEWLYEKVTEDATTEEEYLAKIYEIADEYHFDFGEEIGSIDDIF